MVRKQLRVTEDQDRRLKALAAATSRSESEFVREAITDLLDRQAQETTDDWKAALQQVRGIWKDRTDLDEFYAANRERRRLRRKRMNELMASKPSNVSE